MPALQPVEAKPRSDGVNPRAQALGGIVSADVQPHADEGLLNDVLGLVVVAQQAESEAEHHRLEGLDDRSEGRLVAASAPFNYVIADCFHVFRFDIHPIYERRG